MTHPLPLLPAATNHDAAATLSRRGVLGALAALPLALHAPLWAQDTGPLKIFQSTALTGPLADLGQAVHQGAKVYFTALNAAGGVNGRSIELNAVDDGYDVPRALANAKSFIADRNCFAIFNCLGTPMVEAMLPQVIESGIPFFAPFTGAASARPKNARNVFNIRASYADETGHLVQHLATIGIKRIAIVHQNNAFGKDVAAVARQVMASKGLSEAAVATIENNSSDAAAAAAKIAASQPEAVIMGLAGQPTVEFVKAIRQQRKGLALYALSVMGSAATLKAMGDDATGITVSQVMPLPANNILPLAREFQQAWKAAGVALAPSHLALEGYVNARVFAEALRRAGRNPTRSSFIDSAWAMKRYDLGGFEVSFTNSSKGASHFVELNMVGRDGRLIR
ncbi:ABC transporter substrate-binding protein [Polaromonas glacialis]|uniref:ABC transporter substrate-binding protein n=1 Tax=Polaromonas glacialis TaxID=866564 RepID=UPI000497E280|nr:ABC transporter substrate-binding protein [Polaromonas glacialis]